MKKCPHCQEEMDEDLEEAGFCSECGEELDDYSGDDSEEDDDDEKDEDE